jgi:hypothetical protein
VARGHLGHLVARRQNLERARLSARRSMQVARKLSEHPNTSTLQLALLEEAVQVYQQYVTSDDPDVRHEMAKTYMTLAYAVGWRRQHARAEELFTQAADGLEKLVHDYPQRSIFQHDLAMCYGRRARILFLADHQRFPEVQTMLRKSCAMLESVSAKNDVCRGPCSELEHHRKWLEDIVRNVESESKRAATASL